MKDFDSTLDEFDRVLSRHNEDPISKAKEEEDRARERDEEAREEARKIAQREMNALAQHFDTDVSIRVDGNVQDAMAMAPQAQQLLRRATLFREAGQPVVKMWSEHPDGSFMWAYLHGPVKQLFIRPGPKVVVLVEEDAEAVFGVAACPDMLSGVVYPGTGTLLPKRNTGDPDTYSVHEFHPTQKVADVYQLDFRWQESERLGIAPDPKISTATLQVKRPKPSMYSGAMKRVVQALYGIGETNVVEGSAVTLVEAKNQYDYRWTRTDGILRGGDIVFLIRVSKNDGVLAMPLPLFECTRSGELASFLEGAGDTQSLAIVTEFGGLPTGETFPEGEDLDKAVASGVVLRLLNADTIAPFYKDPNSGIVKSGFFAGCGWAFSESGSTPSVHNTCWWYSRPDIVAMPFKTWSSDGYNNAPALDRYMRAEHWKVEFTFTVDLATSNVGVSAELILVDQKPVEAPNSNPLYDWDNELHSTTDYCGYFPVTGKVGRFGTEGQSTLDNGYLYASGMDWTRFPDSFTPALRSGARSGVQAEYLCHNALMAVPRDDVSDKLDRFVFWGRSQSLVHIVDMEPAVAAPVFIFYAGENLEIVYRKAERYVSDRETVAAFDLVPGTSYPGDFFATSLDLLNPVRTVIATGPGTVTTNSKTLPQYAHIGLIIPAFLREGYVFVKAEYDSDKVFGVGGEIISYTMFSYPYGVVKLASYVSDYNDWITAVNFGSHTKPRYELMVSPCWQAHWTNTYFDWNLGISQTGLRFAVSQSANSKHVAMHAEFHLGWLLSDVPFSWRLSMPYPTSEAPGGLAAVYKYVLPEGVTLDNANPKDVTFVGAV